LRWVTAAATAVTTRATRMRPKTVPVSMLRLPFSSPYST
jgi:hypothetical protein